jgi:hypothetical protein
VRWTCGRVEWCDDIILMLCYAIRSLDPLSSCFCSYWIRDRFQACKVFHLMYTLNLTVSCVPSICIVCPCLSLRLAENLFNLPCARPILDLALDLITVFGDAILQAPISTAKDKVLAVISILSDK